MARFFRRVAAAVCLTVGFLFFLSIIADYGELFSTQMRHSYMHELERGDLNAIAHYTTWYIADEWVLFDGPLSRELWDEFWLGSKPFPTEVANVIDLWPQLLGVTALLLLAGAFLPADEPKVRPRRPISF